MIAIVVSAAGLLVTLGTILLGCVIIIITYFYSKIILHSDSDVARKQHKKTCEMRAAELRDEALFKQPPPNEDCPICMLPLTTVYTGKKYNSCCGKRICSGCIYAVAKRDGGVCLCPFCRTPAPNEEEITNIAKKRVEVGDANAMHNLGCYYNNGQYGLPQDCAKAFELWNRAAELGVAAAYYNIGCSCDYGIGMEMDKEKAKHYYELAVMGGDVGARHNLGLSEGRVGTYDRALKHFMIATSSGLINSLTVIQEMFKKGLATKEDYTQALRSYQAYLGEIKSVQRDEAAAFDEDYKYC